MDHTKTNRFAEAFKENFNVLGLATAGAAALALMATPFMPIPILAAVVAEAAYLLFVPDSRWYQMRMAQRFDGEIDKRRAHLKMRVLPTLTPQMQSRFARLESVRASIVDQAGNQPEWFREVLRKLDFLLEKFLHFAQKDAQFRGYLETVMQQECGDTNVQFNAPQLASSTRVVSSPQNLQSNRGAANASPTSSKTPTRVSASPNAPAANNNGVVSNGASHVVGNDAWTQAAIARIQKQYDGEMAQIRTTAENEGDINTRAVLEKRLDVMQRRREYIGKIGRIQTNLHHQLSLLEDTFGLISDEIRAQPPEQVLADINDVVSQTNTMSQLLEEFAPFENSLSI